VSLLRCSAVLFFIRLFFSPGEYGSIHFLRRWNDCLLHPSILMFIESQLWEIDFRSRFRQCWTTLVWLLVQCLGIAEDS